MTEKLPPGKIESLLPLLKDQAELIKKNNSPSTSELFNILLLGIDLEEQKWATNELKKWEEILKKAKDTEDETIKEATWRALMLRGVPEASARLAVETVSASLIIKPNEEISVPKSSTNIKSDIKLPINIDCESISFGELKPGKSAEKKIKISGGPGNIRVNSDVITVNPDYFGPQETIITVKIKNGIRGQIIWSEIVLEDSEESKTIPVTARWSDDGLNKLSANPIDRQAAIEKDLKIINTNKLPPTVPKTPKIPAVNYPTTVIRKPNQPKINKGNKILLPITIVIILILISGLIFAKNFKFLKYINVAGEETLNKNYNVTEEYYVKNSEKNPDNIEKLLKMAEKSLSNKDFPSAINNYLKVIKLEPSNIKAHKGLAELYNLNKNYILLKDELDKLLSFGNKDLIIYYNESGKYFYQQKDYKKSVDCFEKFLQVNPDNLETHRSMGKIYMENNDYQNAIKEYKRVLDLSGSDKEAYINTGTAYYRLKDYNSANEWFKKAIQTKLNRDEKKSIISMNIECYLKIGQMNSSQFKYKKAEENFKNVLWLDNTNLEAKKGLAVCYLNEGKKLFNDKKYKEAKYYFDKVMEINTEDTLTTEAGDYISKISDKIKYISSSSNDTQKDEGKNYNYPYTDKESGKTTGSKNPSSSNVTSDISNSNKENNRNIPSKNNTTHVNPTSDNHTETDLIIPKTNTSTETSTNTSNHNYTETDLKLPENNTSTGTSTDVPSNNNHTETNL